MFQISAEVLIFVAFFVGLSIYMAKSSAERSRERELTSERNTTNAIRRGHDAGLQLAQQTITETLPHLIAIVRQQLEQSAPPRPMNDEQTQTEDYAGTGS